MEALAALAEGAGDHRLVGLDTTCHHVIIVRQNTVQLMTASMFHVTNLTPGSDNQNTPFN
jgi:hypothetical protein